MKKLLLAGSIALLAASGTAFAQTADQTWDRSATGGQGGRGVPERGIQDEPHYYNVPPGVTTGMVVVRPAPVIVAPMAGPYDYNESSQGNVGPGTGYYSRW